MKKIIFGIAALLLLITSVCRAVDYPRRQVKLLIFGWGMEKEKMR
jgi:hypothetical protein